MLGTNCDFSDVGHWNARCRRHRRPGRGAKLGKGAALRRAYPPEKAKGGSLGIHGAGVAGLSSRVGAGSSAQLPVGMNARQWSVNGSKLLAAWQRRHRRQENWPWLNAQDSGTRLVHPPQPRNWHCSFSALLLARFLHLALRISIVESRGKPKPRSAGFQPTDFARLGFDNCKRRGGRLTTPGRQGDALTLDQKYGRGGVHSTPLVKMLLVRWAPPRAEQDSPLTAWGNRVLIQLGPCSKPEKDIKELLAIEPIGRLVFGWAYSVGHCGAMMALAGTPVVELCPCDFCPCDLGTQLF